MKKFNSYTELIAEERRLTKAFSEQQTNIEEQIERALNPTTLFQYLNEKIKEQLPNEISDTTSVKDYLVGLSLDYLFFAVTTKLLKEKEEKKFSIKRTIRTTIEKYYVQNQSKIKELVNDFVDLQLSKIRK